MLTVVQKQLLQFIYDESKRDVCPSYDEMKEHMRVNSKSGVHRLILALEERGFIRRLKNRARSIRVLQLPDGTVNPDYKAERDDQLYWLNREVKMLKRRLSKYEDV